MTATAPFVGAHTGLSRVFLIEGRARPDHTPRYMASLRAGTLAHDGGDVTRIEAPDPDRHDSFIEIGQFRGEDGRYTTSLEGRYALDVLSTLHRLHHQRCPVDIQVHFGECSNPSVFNTFSKVLIIEDATLSSYNADDLGALASGDRGQINENVDVSSARVYEVGPLSFSREADDLVTVRMVDIVVQDVYDCANCGPDMALGAFKIYAISLAAGGSSGTPPDVVFSIDGGVTWYAHDIDTMGAAQDPSGLAILGENLVVVAQTDCALHYAPRVDFNSYTDPAWTRVTTGFNASGCPTCISAVAGRAFIGGANGYIYLLTDPVAGVTVLDAANAVTNNLNSIHALNENFVVACGNNGTIAVSENGTNFRSITPPVVAGVHFYAVWVKDENTWLFAASNGNLYRTCDGGQTFSTIAFPGSGSGVTYDITGASESVLYLAHATSAPAGRILRSIDGGRTFYVLPEGPGSLPSHASTRALAASKANANFVAGCGLGTGTDGILLIGQGSYT